MHSFARASNTLRQEKSEKLLQIHVHHENEYQIAAKHQHMNLNYARSQRSNHTKVNAAVLLSAALLSHNQIYNSSIKNLR